MPMRAVIQTVKRIAFGRAQMGVRNGEKKFVCGIEVGERDVIVIKDETWLTGEGGRRRREKRNGIGGGDVTPVDGGAGAVHVFDSFVMCGRFALKGLTKLCPEKDAGMLVDGCFSKVQSSKAVDVTNDAVDEVEFEIA